MQRAPVRCQDLIQSMPLFGTLKRSTSSSTLIDSLVAPSEKCTIENNDAVQMNGNLFSPTSTQEESFRMNDALIPAKKRRYADSDSESEPESEPDKEFGHEENNAEDENTDVRVELYEKFRNMILEQEEPKLTLTEEREFPKLDYSKLVHASVAKRYAEKMQCFPEYNGPAVELSKLKPIAFMTRIKRGVFQECWQDDFEKRLYPSWRTNGRPWCYLQQRLFFLGTQHALAITPVSGDYESLGISLRSEFGDIYGQDVDLFFHMTTNELGGGRRSIFYAGKYRFLRVDCRKPFSDRSYFESWHLDLNGLIFAVQGAQVRGERLTYERAKEVIKSAAIKFEYVGLQCVGFDMELYNHITFRPPASSSKMKRRKLKLLANAGDERPSKKRRSG
uniref:Uncharacterized protein n=1 Tax=Moniliophthora roreri TaxID=221103 RepID=A0A0W0FL17_MONRR